MIVQWRHIDCAGGLRSNQQAGHALYSAPARIANPERLAHTGALSTRRTRAGGQARYGRRLGTVALLLAALVLLAVLFGARPAAGAVDPAPRRPCPAGWTYKLTRRAVGTHIVIQYVCVRSRR